MAFLARYGSLSPAEYDQMAPFETIRFANQIAELRRQEIDLQLNLARFAAGAKVSGGGEEVR